MRTTAKPKSRKVGTSEGYGSGIGGEIHALATRLWPINRSLTGNGVRETLCILREMLPALELHEVPTGTEAFDWRVPNEWNVREAWIEGPGGERVVDFAENNLHLVGYSAPIDATLTLDELEEHLHSLPEMPDAVPYVTSYYSARWGFCLRHRDRAKLEPGNYHVHIDATLVPGALTYGELFIPGKSKQEILLSTYVCHPSMANNELSGICVTAFLAKWLSESKGNHYSYRFIFVPETIGSIVYLSRHLEQLKKAVIAGFNVSCVGDDGDYSYLPSRAGNTLADRAALRALRDTAPEFTKYSFLDRGSDERQYCAPGVDLPVATIMRSKYGEYPEYHTSLDDLDFITPSGLAGGFGVLQRAIRYIEGDCRPMVTVLCEPQLGRRGLYPSLSTRSSGRSVRTMMDLIAYSDGKTALSDIAETIGAPFTELLPVYEKLREQGLLRDARMSE